MMQKSDPPHKFIEALRFSPITETLWLEILQIMPITDHSSPLHVIGYAVNINYMQMVKSLPEQVVKFKLTAETEHQWKFTSDFYLFVTKQLNTLCKVG